MGEKQAKRNIHLFSFSWKRDRLLLVSAGLLALVVPFLLWAAHKASAQGGEAQVLIDEGGIAAGVVIGGADVSGQTESAALAYLSGNGTPLYASQKMVLVLPDRTIEIPVADLPVTANPVEAVKSAMLIGRRGGISQRVSSVAAAQSSGSVVYITYTFDQAALAQKVAAIAASIPRESTQGSFAFDPLLPERFAITEAIQGFTPDEAGLLENIKAALTAGTVERVTVPGTVSGVTVDPNTTGDAMEHVKLVAKYPTHVSGDSDRVHNVKTAAALVNGKVVQPGATFSVNDTLGPRTKAAGIWKKAPAIVGGDLEEQYGGGICQVSSTLFNAVARADLETVEWVHHSIPSHYVPIGCDATVNTGGPDFKFKNNTQWPVYLVFVYDETTRTLTCEVWGRPLADGQYIDIIGKLTGTTALPEATTTTDPEAVSDGRGGKYSKTYKVWYAVDGTEIKRELIDTNYYPSKAPVVLITPTPSSDATPDPASTPTP